MTPLLALALLAPQAAPVEIQGVVAAPGLDDTLAPILAVYIGDDSGVIPVALTRIVLPAPDKPGDPSELLLVTDDDKRSVVLRMRLVAADRNGASRYAWEGDRIGLPQSRLLIAAPVDTAWMRLSSRRKLSRTLELDLVRAETGEAVTTSIRALKRPKGADTIGASSMDIAKWAASITNLIALVEPGHYEIPKGAWQLDRDLVVPFGATLHIRAGTTLYLAPSRNIFAYGRLLAAGTAESPVTIRPAGKGPWGVIAFIGEGSGGSKLMGTRMIRGSHWFAGARDLNGAITIIDSDVLIDGCRIEDVRGEDALHAENARVVVARTAVTNAASDGIDLERTVGRIEHCELRDIGDDAIDAGEKSKVTVTGSMIRRAGGKGISVGQESTLEVSESFLIEGGRGISAFEGSVVTATATVIAFSRRTDVQAAARRGTKAGRAELIRCLLWQHGSEKALKSEWVTLKHSRSDVPIDLAQYAPVTGPAGIVIGPKRLTVPLPPLADYSHEAPKLLIAESDQPTAHPADLDTSSWLVFGAIVALLGGLLFVERRLRV